MGRPLGPGGLRVVGRRVLLRLLAAGRDVRPVLDTRDFEPEARTSFTSADHDRDVFDAIAGSEYLDDRIRFQE